MLFSLICTSIFYKYVLFFLVHGHRKVSIKLLCWLCLFIILVCMCDSFQPFISWQLTEGITAVFKNLQWQKPLVKEIMGPEKIALPQSLNGQCGECDGWTRTHPKKNKTKRCCSVRFICHITHTSLLLPLHPSFLLPPLLISPSIPRTVDRLLLCDLGRANYLSE